MIVRRLIMRLCLAGAILVAAATALVACGGGSAGAGAQDGTIKVAVLRQPHLFAPHYYERFLPDGMKVETVPFSNSTEIKNAVNTGSADFGVTGITSALQGAASNEPVRVIASAADGGSAIIARAGSGIRDVGDLRGRRIGYVPGSSQDILLRLLLRRAGLDPQEDVQLLKIAYADMPDALERGSIDAFSGAEIGPSTALSAGARLVSRPYDTPIGKINIVLVTSQSLIEGDPELVRQVVAAHAEASRYMSAHKDRWAGDVARVYGSKRDVVRTAIDNIEPRWTLDAAYERRARALGDQLRAEKQMRSDPDYEQFFDESFLPREERS